MTAAVPKLVRASSSNRTNGVTNPSSSYRDWRNRQALRRNPSSRSSATSSAAPSREEVAPSYPRRGYVDSMDPDIHSDGRDRYNHFDDWSSDDEETQHPGPRPAATAPKIDTSIANPPLPSTLPSVPSLISPAPPPPDALDSSTVHDRKGWQSFLASVLGGDVLQGESVRIGEERGVDEAFRQDLGRSLWWQIRAKLRRRTEEDERRRTQERRSRLEDRVLEEIDSFVVKSGSEASTVDPTADERTQESEIGALDQVNYALQKLSLIESLYPNTHAFREAKALYRADHFQAKVEVITSWSTIVTALQAQLAILQKWTGTDDLDVTRPNTTKEKALVGKSRYHPSDGQTTTAAGDQAADDSTFLERIMKEDSLKRTFSKRIFRDLDSLVLNAKETVILHSDMFEAVHLPDFTYELVRLISFPCKLIIEILKVRLDAAKKLSDPNLMVIDDMIDSFRSILEIAVDNRSQYDDLTAPDEAKRWKIPACLPPEYDQVLLDGLRTFFRLLQFKLRKHDHRMALLEVEVLEMHLEFLHTIAQSIPGGDLVVVESFCSLTNRLLGRTCHSFERQLHIPAPITDIHSQRAVTDLRMQRNPITAEERKIMSPGAMLSWYSKMLDAVRMRYRKLQRFARKLATRYDNSADYSLEPEDVIDFFDVMQETGHILIHSAEIPQGTYILADGFLKNEPEQVKLLLQRSFLFSDSHRVISRRPSDNAGLEHEDAAEEDALDLARYLLVVSTMQPFMWTGVVMVFQDKFEYTDLEVEQDRIRLIADGPAQRLSLCKRVFMDALSDEDDEPLFGIDCLVEARAHLPRIQRQLEKIAKSSYHLSELFIESAVHVREKLGNAADSQDMMESWFQFASEHGIRHASHAEPVMRAQFVRLLMRLAIAWCSFICDSCDPTQRKTFRWTVMALRTTFSVTDGDNILQLDREEFELLKKSVAALISLLISHFDILGARGTMEAKRESEKAEAMRRIQRASESIEDLIVPRGSSPSGERLTERSLRLTQEDRLRLIAELEAAREGMKGEQHLVGQVLDEQVSEDRALVFLATSKSNIALRWQQGQYIGGGANGSVYIGFNLDSGAVMAVKEIRVQDFSNSPVLYKQIKDESDVMSMLNHANIVEYYGIEVHRDRVFIFQEYCEDGSLADQLAHGRIDSEEIIIWYAYQMLQGLQYLHGKGIEHRDVKPENILMTRTALKFVDFGAAKVVVKGNRTMAKTRALKTKAPGDGPGVMNSFAGTPMYMAPEVIRATERAGKLGSADIWSTGCVLLELATGRKPWSNLDNEWAIMFHIGIATQHPPLPERGELSDAGISFIERCLMLDASERPTASELLEDPWLQPVYDQFEQEQEAMDGISATVPSGTSTMVDEPTANEMYVKHLAHIAEMAEEGSNTPGDVMTPFSVTPDTTSPPPPETDPEP
ncbi:hypothetical protein BD324DRAFT_609596 [Kockovaella imperatae]|uniref:Protein kinase domain-containing protein n=1 Tax=Kockovaella imperatae TaxID=4999 RepID=A0A1Y1UBH3_9TREE|nr:hypothetical protein BD324DRAFT_609596 [Kockovaella imperatae]ORX35369.1 hypothetical protein BD324DRAFT_609596 [Kockovaella imperatae]